MTVFVNFEEGL